METQYKPLPRQKKYSVGEPKYEKEAMFKGFWKYFGITGTFFVGAAMFWLGVNIMLNDWARVREAMGPLGNLVLAPLFVGFALATMSFIEFRRSLREGDF